MLPICAQHIANNPSWLSLRVAVSVNDMKMSAQNLSRSAFCFLRFAIAFAARFEQVSSKRKNNALFPTDATRFANKLFRPVAAHSWRSSHSHCLQPADCSLRRPVEPAPSAGRSRTPAAHGGGCPGQSYGCRHGLHADLANQRPRTVSLSPCFPPGQYTLEVTKQGFKLASSPDVQVIVAETTVLNIQMEMGAVTETVNVALQPWSCRPNRVNWAA